MGRVVLVTGLSRDIALRCARLLADQGDALGIDKVVGVDVTPPREDLGGVKFVRADIRTPVIAKVIAVEDVDTVVHLDLGPAHGRGAAKELNVIGTMQLLAACQRVSHVTTFVLGSSTAVYGTSARSPALFTESSVARGGTGSGFPKDVCEVEGYVRGFARRRPDVRIVTLRSAQVLDAGAPLASYFANPVLPTVAGYDPRLQFLHVHDALEVLRRAVVDEGVQGTFNVAGDGVVMLSQAVRRLGRPTVPFPPVGFGTAARTMLRAMGSDITPDLHRLLMHGRVVDTTALRTILGYAPAYTSAEAFSMFAAGLQPGLLSGRGAS
ncbi:NAD-dependent epimerase/dehydratase family protein [Aeromicrobium massiliense]|uniref:NAD-dependent epimerase/dehydratase family protein n=1 Tax=Aeromicrobium massiliense TaxID=1464554 RepID=UPI0002E38D59|nr:NAD-dependent epimerase/dehydratase family protein [Aeromicrobium massiliense]